MENGNETKGAYWIGSIQTTKSVLPKEHENSKELKKCLGKILFFQLPWVPNIYLVVKFSATEAPTFFGYIISVLKVR